MRYKIIATVLFLFFYIVSIQAQQIQIGLAPEINFPTGNASNISGIGVGAALMAEVSVSPKYAVSASGGYNLFVGKKYFGNRIQNISAVPVKLGLKYYSAPEFYLEGQVGAAFHQSSTSKTSFVWSPGFGTYFKTGANKQKVMVGLRYEGWTNATYNSNSALNTISFSFIGLKLGYQFGL